MEILEYELGALIFSLIIASDTFQGRPPLFFCDNAAADAAIISGANRSWARRGLRSVFLVGCDERGAPAWLEYVNTTINPGGAPSRVFGILPPPLRSSLQVDNPLIPNALVSIFATFDSLLRKRNFALLVFAMGPHRTSPA